MADLDPLVAALVDARRTAGWSQLDLSHKSGVSLVTVARMETGRQMPRVPALRAIAGVHGLDIALVPQGSTGGGEPA